MRHLDGASVVERSGMAILGSTVSLGCISPPTGRRAQNENKVKSMSPGPASIKSIQDLSNFRSIYLPRHCPPRPLDKRQRALGIHRSLGRTSHNDMCVTSLGQRRNVGIDRRQNRLRKESNDNGKAHDENQNQKEVRRILKKTALCSPLISGMWELSGTAGRGLSAGTNPRADQLHLGGLSQKRSTRPPKRR